MGFLFVPLSTISMNSIARERMGNATSLFSLMRNLGAGIGIASVATMVSRRTTMHAAILSEHLTPYSEAARNTLGGLRSFLSSRGAVAPDQQSLAAIAGMVQKQAAMIAFIDVVRLLGAIFLVVIPLVFIMRRSGRSGSVQPARTENANDS